MATPLTLSMSRQGAMITMACMQTDEPLVRPYSRQVSEILLVEIGAELASITTLAHHRAALGPHRAVRYATTVQTPREPDEAIHRLQRLGEMLFTQCFPLEIQQRLSSAAPAELILRLSDQLVHVPWELAFDGSHFLLSKFRIGRQVETAQHFPRPVPVPSARLRMLIIADPTENLAAAQQEGELLCDLLEARDNLEVTFLGGKQWRKLDLLKKLHEYDIVHYAGHAYFDPAEPSRSGWVLHDDVLTASELRGLTHPPLLVFSNACQAGVSTPWHDDSAPDDSAYEGQAFGIGSAFLLAGVRNYIGTFCVIHDEHSAAFAAAFYQSFFDDTDIGQALAAARQQVRQQGTPDDLLWASYMHYGNPAFRLRGPQPDPVPPASAAPLPAPAPDPPRGSGEGQRQAPPEHRWPWFRHSHFSLLVTLLSAGLIALVWLSMSVQDAWVSPPVTLALVPFEEHFIVPRLSQILLDSGKITLVEREKLQQLLAERHLEPHDIDQKTAIALGKLLAARIMAFGTWHGSDQAGMLSLRLVDVEKGEIIMADTKPFDTADGFTSLPADLAHDVLRTLAQAYPRQGRITEITSQDLILLNIGKAQDVTPGLVMEVFAGGSGGVWGGLKQIFGSPAEPPFAAPIGQIQIVRVDPGRSQARVLQRSSPLQPGWRVREQRHRPEDRHSGSFSGLRGCSDGA